MIVKATRWVGVGGGGGGGVMQAYDGPMGYSGGELNKTSFYY